MRTSTRKTPCGTQSYLLGNSVLNTMPINPKRRAVSSRSPFAIYRQCIYPIDYFRLMILHIRVFLRRLYGSSFGYVLETRSYPLPHPSAAKLARVASRLGIVVGPVCAALRHWRRPPLRYSQPNPCGEYVPFWSAIGSGL